MGCSVKQDVSWRLHLPFVSSYCSHVNLWVFFKSACYTAASEYHCVAIFCHTWFATLSRLFDGVVVTAP